MMTTNNASTAEIIDTGINCLIENMGTIETERFISALIREKSDYTKWRRKYFSEVSSDEFHTAAVEYAKKNPL